MPSDHQPHVLVVDDEPRIRELLKDCLEGEGFRISEAEDGQKAEEALARGGVDLVTLDLMLGVESGLAVAASIRRRHKVAIVMITGKSDIVDRVVGLELGADDYIAKPFHPREVVARLRAVLRRVLDRREAGDAPRERLRFGRYTLDLGRRLLLDDGQEARVLTTAEFNLLQIFARRPQRVLSRDMLMDLLKGHDWTPYDRSIDALIARLRRKIEADPARPELVKTVRGIGYVFAVEVSPG